MADELISLDGEWLLAFSEELPAKSIRTISEMEGSGLVIHEGCVPGNLETSLHKLGLIADPFEGMNAVDAFRFENCHVWYARRFEAPARAEGAAQLVFEGIDCFADIYVDGRKIGQTDNMLVEWVFPVDDLLGDRPRSVEILVHIRPAMQEARAHDYPPGIATTNYESLYIRKAPHMFGWDIMPRAVSAGIWRPVSLRYLKQQRLDSLDLRTASISQETGAAELVLNYRVRAQDMVYNEYEIIIDARCGAARAHIRRKIVFEAGRESFTIPDAQLWWPRGRGAASLYDITVSLLKNGSEIDKRSLKFGVRTVELLRSSTTNAAGDGEFCFCINGEKTFVKGANWSPLDAYHSRDVERVDTALALAEEIGCNMLRCWGGNVYESDRFFDLCDEKGIMIWQDFAMACAVYPQDAEFQARLEVEVRKVVRRLRNHACVVLWCGDNECDQAYGWHGAGDPNRNALTRKLIPDVLRMEDPSRPYLPSSPFIDEKAYRDGEERVPENHLWGPRNYFKSDYYRNSICHFVSEVGYHGSPSVGSLSRFISKDKLWPPRRNDQWKLHSTSPICGVDPYGDRVELMLRQIRDFFGKEPDNLEDYVTASQALQAEAMKFFVEMFRSAKWRRTGIIWWNLMDGWPQFSDSVVDYYFDKKPAFEAIKRAQEPVHLVVCEPDRGKAALVICNDTRDDAPISYRVRDLPTERELARGDAVGCADTVTKIAEIACDGLAQSMWVIEWSGPNARGKSHYLAGAPPFDLQTYCSWRQQTGLALCVNISGESGPCDVVKIA